MTKRFTYIKNNSISQYSVLPIQEIGGKNYHCQSIVDKLNILSDENERLKQVNEMLQMDFAMTERKLIEENEQLKSENNMLKVTIGRNEAYIKRLTETSEWHC